MKIMNVKSAYLLIVSSLFIVNSTAVQANFSDDSTYCSQAGGTVEDMPAIFHTRAGDVTGLTKSFCTFSVDHGHIVIGLEAFASDAPSLAATYMKQLDEVTEDSPLWKGGFTNPSYNVCRNLGGTLIGFATLGSFTSQRGEADVCVFGDGSMVSAWSLIYMAAHREGYDDIKNQVKAEPLNIELKQAKAEITHQVD